MSCQQMVLETLIIQVLNVHMSPYEMRKTEMLEQTCKLVFVTEEYMVSFVLP